MNKRRTLPALVLLLSAVLTAPVSAQSGELTLAQFWDRIAEIHTELTSGETLPQSRRESLAGSLEAISSVTLPDGTELPIDTGYLAGMIRGDPPDPARAGAILGEALALRGRVPPRVFGPDALSELAEILAGPRFQWAEPETANPLAALWQRFVNWTARLLVRFLPGAGAGQVINALAVALITALLAVLLRYVYVNAMRSVIHEADLDPMEGVPANLTSEQAARLARERADAGDLRDAVRYLYLSAIYRLEERGQIRLDRAHTNRELVRDLAARPELAAGFRSVVETFDRVWYGFRPISEEEFGEFSESVGRLL